jgi:hypothetical protein
LARHNSIWFAVPAAFAAASPHAYAVQYLSIEQAQQLMFLGTAKFDPYTLQLSADQQKQLAAQDAVLAPHEPRIWKVSGPNGPLGHFMVHEVIGRQELITYAVAIGNDGKLKQVEILDYRESHGYEVRNPRWRQQFVNKAYGDKLRLEEDIVNISGATLSCRHVTDGIRRLLALHRIVLATP